MAKEEHTYKSLRELANRLHARYLPSPDDFEVGVREHSTAWEKEVNTLTNERDLARRANEQNIKIIQQLKRQLRKQRKS